MSMRESAYMLKSRQSPRLGDICWPLVWLGVLGLALAAICTVVAVIRGLTIPPEGDLTKVIIFNGAVGLFWITLAFFVALAQFSATGLRVWLAVALGFTLYAYALETIQTLRGLDPRFTRTGGAVDQTLGILFGVLAIVLIVAFAVLGVKLARRGTDGPNGLILLALRYAVVAAMIAFASGVWMSVIQSRYTGLAGNILPLHAFGFHALQAVPLVAWLFNRSATPEPVARPWVHAAGLAWLGATLAIGWQTLAGRSVTELSAAILSAGVFFCAWLVCAVRALQAWRASRPVAVAGPAG